MITAAEQRKADEKFLRRNGGDEGGAGEKGSAAQSHVDGYDPKSGASSKTIPEGAGPFSTGPTSPADAVEVEHEDHPKDPRASLVKGPKAPG